MTASAGASRRRTFAPVVLAGLLDGGLAAFAGSRTAVHAHAAGSAGLVAFADPAQPLVVALSLVVLACWGVVLVTRGGVRRAVAGLALVVSIGALVTVVAGWWTLVDCVESAYREAGVGSVATSHTAWWWVSLVAATLSCVGTALAVRWSPGWAEMSSRYDAPAASADPAAEDSLAMWRALDEGRDPTEGRDP